ncbi:MAG: ketoacyl-ACP synthase III [Gammaproteobacteria bacterium]|nr:ketoacyl-ACP synthase III [Gammaproteobacteria bacterium]
MVYAAITGWGKCMPPAVLTNADLATFLDTTDEWIVTRTGMRERRISHVSATVAGARALACAGLAPADLDLIVYGSCSYDEQVPNAASGVQVRLGAANAAAMDINTACTSFLYGLSAATALVRTGVVRNALVIGVELISPYMDWSNRNVAVLFGDGAAAVVLQAGEREEGLIGEHLGCQADARQTLRIRGMGCAYANRNVLYGHTQWDFDGQEIYRRAVKGMAQATGRALAKCGLDAAAIDLVVPHQANLRIIEGVAKLAHLPMDKVFLTVERYANMSAATVPVALVEALEAGRVRPGALLLAPAFGGGLTLCSHVIRWGERVTPLGTSPAELPPVTRSALEIVNGYRALAARRAESEPGLQAPVFAESRPGP